MKFPQRLRFPIFLLLLIVLVPNIISHRGYLLYSKFGASPVIDGVIDEDEWKDAEKFWKLFPLDTTSNLQMAILFVKNDLQNLYLALLWRDDSNTCERIALYFDFDDDGFFEDEDNDPTTADDSLVLKVTPTTSKLYTWDGGTSNFSSFLNPAIKTASTLNDSKYSVEISIPLTLITDISDPDELIKFLRNPANTLTGIGMNLDDPTLIIISDGFWWPTAFVNLNTQGAWDSEDASGMGDLKTRRKPIFPPLIIDRFKPRASHTRNYALTLQLQAEELLKEAQKEGIDTSECEVLMEQAERLMEEAQELFESGNYIAANNLALKAIRIWEEAIQCLEDLLG
ncbi:MAG: hypothetical protein ACE5K0_01350 [Candidatus Methanofastidiosia archaeon]